MCDIHSDGEIKMFAIYIILDHLNAQTSKIILKGKAKLGNSMWKFQEKEEEKKYLFLRLKSQK